MSSSTNRLNLNAKDETGRRQVIHLKSQDAGSIPGFIVANAICPTCQRPTPANDLMAAVTPEPCDCDPPVRPGRHPVVQENSHEGEELVICGAGPSLSNFRNSIGGFKGDVWGANRGLNYLHDWGIAEARGIAIDPFTRMFGELWAEPFDTTYYLATTVNPGLVWHLEEHGMPIRYFHSARGAPDEALLYHLLYPETCVAGSGLNVVNRAVELAAYMGYERIYLAGADNALGPNDELYADGGSVGEDDVLLDGEIDGKFFRTKSDMLMSAVELARRQRELKQEGVRVIFLGDTLPRALEGKTDAYLKRVVEYIPDENV